VAAIGAALTLAAASDSPRACARRNGTIAPAQQAAYTRYTWRGACTSVALRRNLMRSFFSEIGAFIIHNEN
jgi:hypothetical protein